MDEKKPRLTESVGGNLSIGIMTNPTGTKKLSQKNKKTLSSNNLEEEK